MRVRKIVVEVPEVVYKILQFHADSIHQDLETVVLTELSGLINDISEDEMPKTVTHPDVVEQNLTIIEDWFKEYPPR